MFEFAANMTELTLELFPVGFGILAHLLTDILDLLFKSFKRLF
jgi:hypothetical protein